MVHNVHDRSFPPSSTSVPPGTEQPTLYSSIFYQTSFHRIANVCYNRVISSPPATSEEVLSMNTTLMHWFATLPEWIKPGTPSSRMYPNLDFSAHKLFWRYCNMRIILHRRAFLERALKGLPLSTDGLDVGALGTMHAVDIDAACAAMCLEAASDSIKAINQFLSSTRAVPNQLEWWYGLHFLFHASFVPLIASHTDISSPQRSEWRADVDRARATLIALKEDPLAERCLRIINQLAPSEQPAASDALHDTSILSEMLQSNPGWSGDELAQTW